ncbi:MAG: hypothetical protein ACFB0C_19690 [Leptolyngbyaceae cyanobacterium]
MALDDAPQWPPQVSAIAETAETHPAPLGHTTPEGLAFAEALVAEAAEVKVMQSLQRWEAEQLIDQIKDCFRTAREKILLLYEGEGWVALGYKSWRDCVCQEFRQSESYLYQQLTAAQIAQRFKPFVPNADEIPESHLREVARLKPEQQLGAYQLALDLADEKGTMITAKLVRAAAARICPKGRERVANDYYPTDRRLIQAFIQGIQHTLPGLSGPYGEPCNGAGDISGCDWPEGRWHTNDIDPAREADSHLDATTPEFWEQFPAVNWVITNPPFDQAVAILKLAWAHAMQGCIFLLRLSFLEPCADRVDLLRMLSDHLRVVVPCNPRPPFRSDTGGGDQVTVVWLVFDRSWSWQRQGIPCPYQFLTGWKDSK